MRCPIFDNAETPKDCHQHNGFPCPPECSGPDSLMHQSVEQLAQELEKRRPNCDDCIHSELSPYCKCIWINFVNNKNDFEAKPKADF